MSAIQRVVCNAVPAGEIRHPVRRLPPLERLPVLVRLRWSDGVEETDVAAWCHAWTSTAALVRHASEASEGRNRLTWLPVADVRRATEPPAAVPYRSEPMPPGARPLYAAHDSSSAE